MTRAVYRCLKQGFSKAILADPQHLPNAANHLELLADSPGSIFPAQLNQSMPALGTLTSSTRSRTAPPHPCTELRSRRHAVENITLGHCRAPTGPISAAPNALSPSLSLSMFSGIPSIARLQFAPLPDWGPTARCSRGLISKSRDSFDHSPPVSALSALDQRKDTLDPIIKASSSWEWRAAARRLGCASGMQGHRPRWDG